MFNPSKSTLKKKLNILRIGTNRHPHILETVRATTNLLEYFRLEFSREIQ